MTTAMNRLLPSPTAPVASAPSGPTMTVSTIPIAIQPSSATTTGTASASIGPSSVLIRSDGDDRSPRLARSAVLAGPS